MIEIEISFNETKFLQVFKKAFAEAAAQTAAPTPEPQTEVLHSIAELARFLGCSTVTAQRYKNEKRFPYKQVGRKVMFNTADVLKAIDSNKKGLNNGK
ncbi:MAG: helix-turn-helix domain-containing protein [Mangrovibacterium sp.]